MSISGWKSKLSKFSQLDGADKWLLLRATAWLLIARLMLAAMPFNRLSARLAAESDLVATESDPEFLERVGYAVRVAANHVPWRSDCFPQAIAARMLLKRYGHAAIIHFGVERVGDDGLEGHAWLTSGDTIVIGDTDLDRYTEIT
jgi:hypothetical protein